MTTLLLCCLAHGVELDEVRVRATEVAIEVARAEAETQRRRGLTWQASSGSLPQIDLFASGSTGQGLTSFGFERPVQVQAGVGVNGSWTLVDPGGWAGAVAARHSRLGADALLDWARVTARRDATAAVAELWAAQEEQRAWARAREDAAKALEAVEALVAAELRPSADAARSRALAAQTEAEHVAAEGRLAGRCARLHALLRDDVRAPCSDVVVPELTVAETQGVHPALVAAREALAASRAELSRAVLDRVPTVGANGTAAHYVAGDANGFGWSAGVQATLPLVSGGAGEGGRREAVAGRDDALLALEAQQLELAAATVEAEASWEAARSALAALAQAEEAAEEALTLTDARYRQGLEGVEAWIAARRSRDDAIVAHARGRGAWLLALAELEAVRGVR